MILKEDGPIEKASLSAVMSYYGVLRNTIHGIDKIMVNIIYQSIALITGALTLSMVCFEKIGREPLNILMAVGLTVLAIFLTWNSEKRINLYIGIQTRTILIAKKIEGLVLTLETFEMNEESSTYRLTHEIENNVPHAGIRGESIYIRAVKVFYALESLFIIIYLIGLIRFLEKSYSFLYAIFSKLVLFIIPYFITNTLA